MDVMGQDVAAFLGRGTDTTLVALAEVHLPIVTSMVRRYVRGVGFTAGVPDDDLAAVIVSCCARQVTNPTGDTLQTSGPFTHRPGTFAGWTLPELAILHSYRKRAQ